MDARNPEPTQDVPGREAPAPVFDAPATMHFNGQSTVELDGTGRPPHDRGRGRVASIRCLDTFVKQDGAWLFAERRLMVSWTDTRPSVS